MKTTARALERIVSVGTRMTKPVRLHMAPRTCVFPSVETAAPGDHKSTCRIEKGAVMGQEKHSSLETRRLERMATQWEHDVTQSFKSEVHRGQIKRGHIRLRV